MQVERKKKRGKFYHPLRLFFWSVFHLCDLFFFSFLFSSLWLYTACICIYSVYTYILCVCVCRFFRLIHNIISAKDKKKFFCFNINGNLVVVFFFREVQKKILICYNTTTTKQSIVKKLTKKQEKPLCFLSTVYPLVARYTVCVVMNVAKMMWTR